MYSLSNSSEVLEKNSTGKVCTKCGLRKELGELYTGKGKRQLDHIKELHTLNLGDRGQFLKAVHVSNYQPLWQDDNIKKSNKIRKLRKKEGV